MTIKQAKKKIEQLADEIDLYLAELEIEGKVNSVNYETLLYISGGLRELLDVEF